MLFLCIITEPLKFFILKNIILKGFVKKTLPLNNVRRKLFILTKSLVKVFKTLENLLSMLLEKRVTKITTNMPRIIIFSSLEF